MDGRDQCVTAGRAACRPPTLTHVFIHPSHTYPEGGACAGAFIGFRSGSIPIMAATAGACSLLCVAIHLKCVVASSVCCVVGVNGWMALFVLSVGRCVWDAAGLLAERNVYASISTHHTAATS